MRNILNGAGHGGKDNGCTAYDGSYEKTYTLELCKAVHKKLNVLNNKTKILRTGDTFIEIADRCKIADKMAPVYWFEWHFNAFNKKTRGIEIFTSNFTSQNNKDFASFLCKGYSKLMGIPNRGAKIRLNSKGQDFYGVHRLSGSTTTVFVIEPVFIDNEDDFAILKSTGFINKTADFFANEILEFVGYKSQTKDYRTILKEVSNYSDIWVSFVKAHPEVNLAGLIEMLYYHKSN